jgi:hypothetical protein
MQTSSFATPLSSIQTPTFILAPAPPPRRRRAIPCPPPPSGRRHSLARKLSFGRLHCTTPLTNHHHHHQPNFLSLIDTPLTATQKSPKTPKTPAPPPRALPTLGYNPSFAAQNTPITRRFVPIPAIMFGNGNSNNNNTNNTAKAEVTGRKRSKSTVAPRRGLPMSYAQHVEIDQLLGGGSDEYYMRKARRQTNKNGRGLDAGISGDVGYGGSYSTFKDQSGAIWFDVEEMQEYAALIESKGGSRPSSWVAFNSDLPPDSPADSTDDEDQPMEVLDDQLAAYGGLSTATPQYRSVLTMPRRTNRVHLSGKSGYLFPPVRRRSSASDAIRAFHINKSLPATPKGKDRRRPPPLDLFPIQPLQMATNSPAPATAPPADDIDGMIAFLAASFKPEPASPTSSVTPPLPTRRRRSRSGSIALHPCKAIPAVANPTSLGNQRRRRSVVDTLAMFPVPPTIKTKPSLGGMFKMGFGSKRK